MIIDKYKSMDRNKIDEYIRDKEEHIKRIENQIMILVGHNPKINYHLNVLDEDNTVSSLEEEVFYLLKTYKRLTKEKVFLEYLKYGEETFQDFF